MELEFVTHESLKPFIYPEAEILILGSLPSIKSREDNFFYAHKTNRFYKVLAAIYNEKPPQNLDEKKDFLKRHKIALYDTIYSCYIHGSSDASIKDITPTNIKELIKGTNIKKIFTTGKLSYDTYVKYIQDDVGIKAVPLPSTSAANASMSFDKIVEAYQIITK